MRFQSFPLTTIAAALQGPASMKGATFARLVWKPATTRTRPVLRGHPEAVGEENAGKASPRKASIGV